MYLFRKLLGWFRRDNKIEKEFIPPELPPYEPPRTTRQRLEGLEHYCEEMRKDLWIWKKTVNRLFVEWGNLKDKLDKLIKEG